jgi:hypothetical protein
VAQGESAAQAGTAEEGTLGRDDLGATRRGALPSDPVPRVSFPMISANDILAPAEAHALLERTHMPYPTGELLAALGFEYQTDANLRKPAITWRARKLVKFRPGPEDDRRAALGHELGHICLAHPANTPQWCEPKAWQSANPRERQADAWMLDYFLPEREIIPWLALRGMRLTRLADLARIPAPVVRRQLKRLGLLCEVWDDRYT